MAVKRLMQGDRVIWFFLIVWILACFALTWLFSGVAHAQIGGQIFSERSSSRPHGLYIVAWNTTGSEIPDGYLVMSDTTGVSSQPQVALGKGFKLWDNTITTSRPSARILGVTIGATPGYAQGRVLVLGFHPWVKMDAASITPLSNLRPSLLPTVPGGLAAWAPADSVSMNKVIIGQFQRYANIDSLRGYCWINTLGAMGGK